MNELYNNTSKFTYDKLNTTICIYQQREQIYRKYREEKLDFIQFDYENMEGIVYDFKIGNLKIQEKVTTICHKNNKCYFQLCKNNGKINNKQNQIQYDIGDNDFYWINCDNKKTFFVIPENILVDKGFIGNKNTKTNFKVTIKEVFHKSTEWLQEYMFDYENVAKDKLIKLLRISHKIL